MTKTKELDKTDREPVRVGISMGDMNGVSAEVIMKSLSDSRILLDCVPIIYGSSKVFSAHKKMLNLNSFNYMSIKEASEAKKRKVNIINVDDTELEIKKGEPTKESGVLSFASLDAATKDLAAGMVDVLVTAPISKEAMGKTDFKFPGHTEYLADLSGLDEALMVMVSPKMRVALVTSHIALKNVATSLSLEKIVEKLRVFNKSLQKDFGIQRPKIAVFGVNPHAGENGKMGDEEREIISPAIQRASGDGVLAFGPYPADGFFGSGAMNKFDGILAMYHDQGLAAFKALAFDEGVNFTAGLPIIRTSPDHGTAYDIVGEGIASESSMRSAIYLAIDVYRRQQLDKEVMADPLEISEKKKRRE